MLDWQMWSIENWTRFLNGQIKAKQKWWKWVDIWSERGLGGSDNFGGVGSCHFWPPKHYVDSGHDWRITRCVYRVQCDNCTRGGGGMASPSMLWMVWHLGDAWDWSDVTLAKSELFCSKNKVQELRHWFPEHFQVIIVKGCKIKIAMIID